VINQLFSFLPSNQIDFFSCGHVIPPENLVGLSLSVGPSQKHLEFTFARRSDLEAVDELGRIVLNLSRVVPGGVVVFFPSYRFEDSTVQRWQSTGAFNQIQDKKTIFREPKQSDELARVLADYSAKCSSSKAGAVLLSVVGGKMSEGINFSDDLARCVVMVGMPYPNARDPELVEKMAFLDKHQPGSGRQFYESLCMKAVNQSIGKLFVIIFGLVACPSRLLLLTDCIGRAIRHQKDYASIILVDHRYSSPLVRRKLPEWIQRRMQPASDSFGYAYSELVKFYKSKATVSK
jgi:chromosome transmission fidelity protein 1